ncbi:hypothetical protein H2201_007210 [Coniosporium apollinis]|uniref:Bromodomain-containing protein n=1 Tax=Coniosporium apollinis TaxID=61459 RepID=A0ABQ9NJK5_9PEZI|nr:hypothetical protein H2201_007210 [Coniosporium apollinis]
MDGDAADTADSPIPTTEPTQTEGTSSITDEQWKALQNVLKDVYAYRPEPGYDPSKLFQRMVNKRSNPGYYQVITKPMALSQIKARLSSKEYKSVADCVRDFAQIIHNAQVFNRPKSGAYQDALVLKSFVETELNKLVEDKIITEDDAKFPYLGEIPEADPEPEEDEEAEQEEEEEDEEDEEDDDSEEDTGRRKRKRGLRGTTSIVKRDAGGKQTIEDIKADLEARKRRGRPPRVDTPMEARIKDIMKGIRKPRNQLNQLMVSSFERVPDKAAMPEYFTEIKQPMAMDILKRKLKRKKYQSVDQFMKDVELMFENAKQYNQDESQIYKDAVFLQKEARLVAEQVKKKPDTDFVMEDGRLPMPNGILHNAELWKVGDWVHIQNANDLTKPIVAQIYRTWQDNDGGKWVNACWYYRPEQTVHRFDKHFYENEVVKTGQYRDHPIEEVIDRCFVMFFTRYNKGRPRNFPSDKEIYVCEARYNEEKLKLNKIKTWASCLPDEVREKDYEMDLFDAPRKMKKVPSPIAYLLKDSQKETDDMPKPEWGAENAPPKIGAVHRRPRDPKDSPPPEPTPSPPPPPPPPPPRQPSMSRPTPSTYTADHRTDYMSAARTAQTPVPAQTPQQHHPPPSFTPSHPQQYHGHSASPAPIQPLPTSSHPSTFQPPSLTPHQSFTSHAPTAAPPMSSYSSTPVQPPPGSYGQRSQIAPPPPIANYNAPRAPEVYHLDNNANASIPKDIRDQFHCDSQGRVLFYTTPPINVEIPERQGRALGHSVRYLAAKQRREMELRAKRTFEQAQAGQTEEARKKARLEKVLPPEEEVLSLTVKALDLLEDQLAAATRADYEALMDGKAQQGIEADVERLVSMHWEAYKRENEMAEREKRRKEKEDPGLRGLTVLMDDIV